MLASTLLASGLCVALAACIPSGVSLPRQPGSLLLPRVNSTSSTNTSVCAGNTASDRSVWCDYSTSTNYYDDAPDTGVTVEYWFELTNTTAAPDGISRDILSVNGSVPGPTIEANWAWEGVFGGIVIHGPATADYDEDLGSLFLNDWDHQTADALYTYAEVEGPPTLDTGLINGTNTWSNGSVGTRFATDFTSGTSYLLRVVNAAIDTHFDFSIDNHTLQVIAMDFVPIVPYTTDSISIGMGQRYDIIVNANMSAVASDFWMRAFPDAFCSDNDNSDDIKGIIHYDGSSSTPTTTGYTITENSCFGESLESLVPFLELDASSSAAVSNDLASTVAFNDDNIFKWYIGSTSFLVEWDDPTALQILNNDTSFSNTSGVIELPTADEWTIVIIETTLAVPHPIHLHGHDFYVLAAGYGTYAAEAPTLQTSNPPRRDVAMLPAAGYLVFAFQADNPGAWLAHCHIGWHTSEGFAIQFVERYDEIAALYNRTELETTCKAWEAWQSSAGLVEDDSGV
ncbi:hypothetical protein LTR36_002065 [Oleoguttula mirabilis]|uniref:Laccase n=1 Tax=Oleoguttula mirabilis TaxID=1507867 RepID=A0AAV9JM12_9PEZI|nr:hypothetical protein LTR36_002065 [Oleoguttula mirabilis]